MNRATNKQHMQPPIEAISWSEGWENVSREARTGGCSKIIEEGSSARREGSSFDAALVNVFVFLPTHAIIHMRMRNKKHL